APKRAQPARPIPSPAPIPPSRRPIVFIVRSEHVAGERNVSSLAGRCALSCPPPPRDRYPRAMRRLGRVLFFLVFATMATNAAAVPTPAKKDKPPRTELPADVETAEQLYAKLDYDKANEIAERVVKQKSLSHDQLVRAYRILAVTDAILDKEEAAR